MGLGQTPIASVAQVESPDALGNRAFDPRSTLVQLLTFGTGLSPSGLLQRLILLPWLQLEPTSSLFGLGTQGAGLTAIAIRLRKDNRNVGHAAVVDALSPERRVFALRTAGSLLLPVDHKLVDVVAPVCSSLPAAVGAGGADQGDVLVFLTADQQGGIDVGAINDVLFWWQPFVYQRLLYRLGALGLMHAGQCRMHMSNQMDLICLTALAQMDDVASPTLAVARPKASLYVIGRFQPCGSRRQFFVGFEANSTALSLG